MGSFGCYGIQNIFSSLLFDTIETGLQVLLILLIECSIRLRTTLSQQPGRVAQSVGHLTRKSGVLGSIPGLATYFQFSFRFFMKGSCQLLAKVCARSTR